LIVDVLATRKKKMAESAKKKDDVKIGLPDGVTLEKLLSICYLIPMGDPLDPACIWGAVPSLQGKPGIGKTGRVKTSAKYRDLPFGLVELGGRQPEDASGAPFLTKNDELIIACLLNAVNELNAKGKGVLLLDDVNWARQATQGAFLSMVQDRRVGDTIFSNHIRMVLASNPQKSAGGGYPLIPPMANRCLHFDVDGPTEDEENTYLMGGRNRQVTPLEDAQLLVQNGWEDVWGPLVGFMIGFKRKFSQYVHAEPLPGDPQHHKAWPSHRSREMALRAVATVRILETMTDENGKKVISPLEDVFVEAACGSKMAVDWAAYRAESDLPDPKDMLTKGYTLDTRMDRLMASVGGMTAYVIGRTKKEEREELAGPAWEICLKMVEAGYSDIALTNSTEMARQGLNLEKITSGPSHKMIKKVMAEYGKRGLEKYIAKAML
jgi:hypothetical protein